MSEINNFNYDLDKITESETVYDFVSRLSIGKNFVNRDHRLGTNGKTILFPAGTKLKDEILMNIITAMDTCDINHLDKIKTDYTTINIGSQNVSFTVPDGYTLYRIVQEKTGYDVTDCFTESNNRYTFHFDVCATHPDIYKAYYYAN